MIVLVLVVIWIVALAPFILRRLSEHQLTTSVAQFRRLTSLFGRRTQESPLFVEVAHEVPTPALTEEEERRILRARARVRHERRRRTLVALAIAGAFTLVAGAIPALRLLWDLAIVDAVLAASYLALLVYLTRLEAVEAERRAMRNVVPIAPRPADFSSRQVAYATAGGYSVSSAPIPLRPAFRIVESPS